MGGWKGPPLQRVDRAHQHQRGQRPAGDARLSRPQSPAPATAASSAPTTPARPSTGLTRPLPQPRRLHGPAPGQWGNARRDSIIGPDRFSLNASLARTFRLHDRYNLDARLDSTNALNHVAYTSWNTIVGSPQFGSAAGTGSMRVHIRHRASEVLTMPRLPQLAHTRTASSRTAHGSHAPSRLGAAFLAIATCILASPTLPTPRSPVKTSRMTPTQPPPSPSPPASSSKPSPSRTSRAIPSPGSRQGLHPHRRWRRPEDRLRRAPVAPRRLDPDAGDVGRTTSPSTTASAARRSPPRNPAKSATRTTASSPSTST